SQMIGSHATLSLFFLVCFIVLPVEARTVPIQTVFPNNSPNVTVRMEAFDYPRQGRSRSRSPIPSGHSVHGWDAAVPVTPPPAY
ncbi:hypothetical protein PENTCL1PPCAC_5895, partial [Pristionchus entomophagus]